MEKKLLETENDKLVDQSRIESLYSKVSEHIDRARQSIQRSIDTEMIKAYWYIGREIVEEEQQGNERAEYGKAILKNLSVKLKMKHKTGFSVDTLETI